MKRKSSSQTIKGSQRNKKKRKTSKKDNVFIIPLKLKADQIKLPTPPVIKKGKKTRKWDQEDSEFIPDEEVFYEPQPLIKRIKSNPNHPVVKMMNVGFKKCYDLHIRLMNQADAYLFNEPVDVVKWDCKDYYKKIKEPMDFGTILSRLYKREYYGMVEWSSDVRLVFRNCFKYNDAGNWVCQSGSRLKSYFEREWKKLLTNEFINQSPYKDTRNKHRRSSKKRGRKRPIKRSFRPRMGVITKFPPKPLSINEKQNLFDKISTFNETQLGAVVEIYKIKENLTGKIEKKNVIDLNLNKMKNETLNYIRFYASTIKKPIAIKKVIPIPVKRVIKKVTPKKVPLKIPIPNISKKKIVIRKK